jgi:hypothetical protein
MADADEAAGRQSAATEPPSSELVEQRHGPGFAVAIPLYLLIGQRAFAVWALAPLVINLMLRPRLRRRHPRAT